MEQYQELSADGFRVLAVAYKDVATRPTYSKDDESDLVLKGYVAFLDPPKDTAAQAIEKVGLVRWRPRPSILPIKRWGVEVFDSA